MANEGFKPQTDVVQERKPITPAGSVFVRSVAGDIARKLTEPEQKLLPDGKVITLPETQKDEKRITPAGTVFVDVVAGDIANKLKATEQKLLPDGETINLPETKKQTLYPLSQLKSDPDFRNQVLLGRSFTREEKVQRKNLFGRTKTVDQTVTSALDSETKTSRFIDTLPKITQTKEQQDAFVGFVDRMLNQFRYRNEALFESTGELTLDGSDAVFESIMNYFGESVDVLGSGYTEALAHIANSLDVYSESIKNLKPGEISLEQAYVIEEAKVAMSLVLVNHIANPREPIENIVQKAIEQREQASDVSMPDLIELEEVAKNFANLQTKTFLPTEAAKGRKIGFRGVDELITTLVGFSNFSSFDPAETKRLVDHIAYNGWTNNEGVLITPQELKIEACLMLNNLHEEEKNLLELEEIIPSQVLLQAVPLEFNKEVIQNFFDNSEVIGVLTEEQKALRLKQASAMRLAVTVAMLGVSVMGGGSVVQNMLEGSHHQPLDTTPDHMGNNLHDSWMHYTTHAVDDSHNTHQDFSQVGSIHPADNHGVEAMMHRDVTEDVHGNSHLDSDTHNHSGSLSEHARDMQTSHSMPVEPTKLGKSPGTTTLHDLAGDRIGTHDHERVQPDHGFRPTDSGPEPYRVATNSEQTVVHKDTSGVFTTLTKVADHTTSHSQTHEVVGDVPEDVAEHGHGIPHNQNPEATGPHVAQPGDILTQEQAHRTDENYNNHFQIHYGETPSHALQAMGETNPDIFGADGESGIWNDLIDGDSIAIHEGHAYIMIYDDPHTPEHTFTVINPDPHINGTPANAILLRMDLPAGVKIDDPVTQILHPLRDILGAHGDVNPDNLTEIVFKAEQSILSNQGNLVSDEVIVNSAMTVPQQIEHAPTGEMVRLDTSHPETSEAPKEVDFYRIITGNEQANPKDVPTGYFHIVDDESGNVVVRHDEPDGSGVLMSIFDSDGNQTYDAVSAMSFTNESQGDALQAQNFEPAVINSNIEIPGAEEQELSAPLEVFVTNPDLTPEELKEINEQADESLIQNGFAVRQAELKNSEGETAIQYTIEVNLDEETGQIVTGRLDGAPTFIEIDETELPQTEEQVIALINSKIEDKSIGYTDVNAEADVSTTLDEIAEPIEVNETEVETTSSLEETQLSQFETQEELFKELDENQGVVVRNVDGRPMIIGMMVFNQATDSYEIAQSTTIGSFTYASEIALEDIPKGPEEMIQLLEQKAQADELAPFNVYSRNIQELETDTNSLANEMQTSEPTPTITATIQPQELDQVAETSTPEALRNPTAVATETSTPTATPESTQTETPIAPTFTPEVEATEVATGTPAPQETATPSSAQVETTFEELRKSISQEYAGPYTPIALDGSALEVIEPYLSDGIIVTDQGEFVPVERIFDPVTGRAGFVFDADSPTALIPTDENFTAASIVSGIDVDPFDLYSSRNEGNLSIVIPESPDGGLIINNEALDTLLNSSNPTIDDFFRAIYPKEQLQALQEQGITTNQLGNSWYDTITAVEENGSANSFIRIKTIDSDGEVNNNTFVTSHVFQNDGPPFKAQFTRGLAPETLLVVTIPDDEMPENLEELETLLVERFTPLSEEWDTEIEKNPLPTIIPTIEPTATTTATATPTVTATPSASATVATATVEPTNTPELSTATATTVPTNTSVPTETNTPLAMSTPVSTIEPTVDNTPVAPEVLDVIETPSTEVEATSTIAASPTINPGTNTDNDRIEISPTFTEDLSKWTTENSISKGAGLLGALGVVILLSQIQKRASKKRRISKQQTSKELFERIRRNRVKENTLPLDQVTYGADALDQALSDVQKVLERETNENISAGINIRLKEKQTSQVEAKFDFTGMTKEQRIIAALGRPVDLNGEMVTRSEYGDTMLPTVQQVKAKNIDFADLDDELVAELITRGYIDADGYLSKIFSSEEAKAKLDQVLNYGPMETLLSNINLRLLSPVIPESIVNGISDEINNPYAVEAEVLKLVKEGVESGKYRLETRSIEGTQGNLNLPEIVVIENAEESDLSDDQIDTAINPALDGREQEIVSKAIQGMTAAYYMDAQVIGLKAEKDPTGQMHLTGTGGVWSLGGRNYRFNATRQNKYGHHTYAAERAIFESQETPEVFQIKEIEKYKIAHFIGRYYKDGELRIFTSEYTESEVTTYSLMASGHAISGGAEADRGGNSTELDFIFSDKEDRDNFMKELMLSDNPNRLLAGLINNTFIKDGEPSEFLNVHRERSNIEHPLSRVTKIIFYDPESKSGKILNKDGDDWLVEYEINIDVDSVAAEDVQEGPIVEARTADIIRTNAKPLPEVETGEIREAMKALVVVPVNQELIGNIPTDATTEERIARALVLGTHSLKFTQFQEYYLQSDGATTTKYRHGFNDPGGTELPEKVLWLKELMYSKVTDLTGSSVLPESYLEVNRHNNKLGFKFGAAALVLERTEGKTIIRFYGETNHDRTNRINPTSFILETDDETANEFMGVLEDDVDVREILREYVTLLTTNEVGTSMIPLNGKVRTNKVSRTTNPFYELNNLFVIDRRNQNEVNTIDISMQDGQKPQDKPRISRKSYGKTEAVF